MSNTYYPSHHSIATAVRLILSYHLSTPKSVVNLIESCLDFDGMHNVEGLDDIIGDLPRFLEEMGLECDSLVRDIATYSISIPTVDEYMEAGVL